MMTSSEFPKYYELHSYITREVVREGLAHNVCFALDEGGMWIYDDLLLLKPGDCQVCLVRFVALCVRAWLKREPKKWLPLKLGPN